MRLGVCHSRWMVYLRDTRPWSMIIRVQIQGLVGLVMPAFTVTLALTTTGTDGVMVQKINKCIALLSSYTKQEISTTFYY